MLKAKMMLVVDTATLAVLGFFWKLISPLDPRPIQKHFAARPPIASIETVKVFNAPMEDAGQSMCRLGNALIKSEGKPDGFVSRNQLVKIYNPANNHFVVLYAMGAGSHKIPRVGISLDYDARVALGITKEVKNSDGEVNLIVGPANIGDVEYFHMYLDHDKSSRSARVLGWVVFGLGVVWSCVQISEGLIETVAEIAGML